METIIYQYIPRKVKIVLCLPIYTIDGCFIIIIIIIIIIQSFYIALFSALEQTHCAH